MHGSLSPRKKEHGLKDYILELLEENRKAEKERLAREINKIDSPGKASSNIGPKLSSDSDFKLPVIKGFGFN